MPWSHVSKYILFVLVVGLSGLVVFGFYQQQIRQEQILNSFEELEHELSSTKRDLATTKNTLAVIIDSNEDLQERIEVAKHAQQANQEVFQKQVSQLQQVLSEKLDEATLSDIINQWQQRVARIRCLHENDDGTGDVQNTASAVAVIDNGVVRFLTNRHVVEKNNSTLTGCELHLPESNESFIVPKTKVSINDSEDSAILTVSQKTSPSVRTAASIPSCQGTPNIGQRILILGYPRTGSAESITATEGIMSGFEEGYYITSAKIEQGNSGGAAVLVDENCFLGMPTLAIAGRIESLARILPVSSF